MNDRSGSASLTQPFSVVFAPATTMVVSVTSSAFIRHLYWSDNENENGPSGSGRNISASDGSNNHSSRLSDAIIAVRAQPCTLHLFRGHRLCRVVEFGSPVVDVAAVLPGVSLPARLLCAVVCRDGTVYALPVDEVLNGTRAAAAVCTKNLARSTESEGVPEQQAGQSEPPVASSKRNVRQRTQGSHQSSSSKMGLFDDLAPTMAENASSVSRKPDRRKSHDGDGSTSSDGGDGVDDGDPRADVSGNSDEVGGLVVRARATWVCCNHFGARLAVMCSDGVAAVVGIVDRASLYNFSAEESSTPRVRNRDSRLISTVDGVDGAAPTTMVVVWLGQEQEDTGGRASAVLPSRVACGNDRGGFPLPPRLFRALFGKELALSQTQFLPQLSVPPTADNSIEASTHGVTCRDTTAGRAPAVLLVGDDTGTVRWAPLYSSPRVPSGVLADLDGQAVVALLPQLDSAGNTIGMLAVGAKGTVLSLGEVRRRVSRKRPRPASPSRSPDNDGRNGNDDGQSDVGSWILRRRVVKVPFPISSAGSTPGFLVHCHAGALFASAIPHDGLPGGGQGGHGRWIGNKSGDCWDTPVWFRPVRLPLPCDTIDVAVRYVSAEAKATRLSKDSPAILPPRALVLSLSARGRLVGFWAPHSTDELEGWGLDSGKGGVRVGGSAGVERRVRCQLERLSTVGRRCAALSTQSAERDREIRILRGAMRLVPSLVSGRGDCDGSVEREPPALAHELSMIADVDEDAAVNDGLLGGAGALDCLRVRLRTRLWAVGAGRRSGLPTPGAEGAGRWFLVTRIVSAVTSAERGTVEMGVSKETAEGWAWSTSAAVPMASLRQGRTWSSSLPFVLPSARPVTVTSWLQFRFYRVANNASEPSTTQASAGQREGAESGGHAPEVVEGVCIQLDSVEFDILDWGIPLPSVPGSAAAVRAAAYGRGTCFCGPELTIADALRGSTMANGGAMGSDNVFGLMSTVSTAVPQASQLPAAWGSSRIRLASSDVDPVALLARLVRIPGQTCAAGGAVQNSFASASSGSLVERSGARIGSSTSAEVATRVAGQVVVLRARRCIAATDGRGRGAPGSNGDGGHGQLPTRVFEIYIICSHEAMSPLVRHAILRRVSSCSVGHDTRAAAAARLTRQVHPLRQAVVDAGDAVRTLGVARGRDGPQHERVTEALALMRRVGEIYQALRLEQGKEVVA